MAETICVRGKVRKGDPCWRLEVQGADQLFLIGDLTKVRDGDVVTACGTIAQAGFCGGPTMAVSFIGTSIVGGDALPNTVTRDVEITATLSTRDLSPTFRIEERDVSLQAATNQWRTRAENVHVVGKLDIFFNSKGWVDQQFTVSVKVTDPADEQQSWSKDFKGTVKKGHVVISGKMDVGAA